MNKQHFKTFNYDNKQEIIRKALLKMIQKNFFNVCCRMFVGICPEPLLMWDKDAFQKK